MTAKHVVADDVLGRIARKVSELFRRILEGSIDPDRTSALLQMVIEGVPKPHDEGASYGRYVLEIRWAWDSSHVEFATIGLERWQSYIPFEDILNPSAPEEAKAFLLEMLKNVYEAQTSGKKNVSKMVRLYRVLDVNYFGYLPGFGLEGTLDNRDAIDVHFILKPICEFDDNCEPIPCRKAESS